LPASLFDGVDECSRNKKTKRSIDRKALFEVYLCRLMMETLRDRRNVPESSSKTSSAGDPRRTHAFRVLAGLPNNQIASRFVEWMACQRYSRGTNSIISDKNKGL
jgi:hypothetical protein